MGWGLAFFLFAKQNKPENERKIEALLHKMTVEEKAGEMTQLALDKVSEGESNKMFTISAGN